MDRDIQTLVRRLTNLNPNQRPCIQELVNDSIFECIDRKPQKAIQPASLLEPTEIEDEMDGDLWSHFSNSNF
jgi:hypothetical protein